MADLEKKHKEADETVELLRTLVTLLSTQQAAKPAANSVKLDALIEVLSAETNEKIERKNKELADVKEMARRNAENAAQGMLMKEAEQAGCRHRMPNQSPSISGQRLSNGVLFMTCVKCQNEWFDFKDKFGHEINNDLIPDGVRLGLGTGF